MMASTTNSTLTSTSTSTSPSTARRTKRWIVAAWVITLLLAGVAVFGKERLLANGDTVYLRLTPVDPRSLMQGDYMALNFAVADAVLAGDGVTGPRRARDAGPPALPRAGVAVVRLDDHRVARFVRVHAGEPLAIDERLLRFQRTPGGWRGVQVQVSTNAFFFQEGEGARYETARYGEFRVDASGEALLVGLRGERMEPL
jgi:uncharacterized membrane-anchored protein